MTNCFLCKHRKYSQGIPVCDKYSNNDICENFEPKEE